MIDIGKIIKRAWHILWNYRVLWIFGILLAITVGGGRPGQGGTGLQYQFSGDEPFWDHYRMTPQMEEFRRFLQQDLEPLFTYPKEHIGTFIAIGVGILLFILIFAAVIALIRYPTETAVMRMVNDYEQTGQKVGFKQGWKMGWSRAAFRMWVIDLILGLPILLLMAIMVAVGFGIYFSVESASEFANAAGVIASVGCFFLFLFVFVIGMVFLGLLRQFFVRKAALENTSIGQSFRQGWLMFKQNWKSGALMWLVMLGLGIAAVIVGIFVFFLLVPAYIILVIPALLVAAIPTLIGFGIASIFTHGILAWIIGALFGLPFFFLAMFLPMTLVSGWFKIFESSMWTLTYREIKALEVVGMEPELPAGEGG